MKASPLPRGDGNGPDRYGDVAQWFRDELAKHVPAGVPLRVVRAVALALAHKSVTALRLEPKRVIMRGEFTTRAFAVALASGFAPVPRSARLGRVTLQWDF